MDKKNFLNKPIVTLGLVMSMTSLTTMTSTNDNILKNDSTCFIQNTNNNMRKVKVSMLEESAEIKNTDLANGYLSYNSDNEKYMMKQNKENFISDVQELFGGMRYLTKEERQEYDKVLDSLYQEVDVDFFDLI